MILVTETTDLAACLALRRAVFIVEQQVSETDEVDGRDGAAIHLLAMRDDTPMGTARLLIDGPIGKIGRVCVLPKARGTGMGQALVHAALDSLRARGCTTARLGAQTHALAFYQALGFAAVGPEYLDAGIPHRDMVRAL